MKRISYIIVCFVSLFSGCRTADFSTSKLNPANLLPRSNHEAKSQEAIEENSKNFLAEIKEKSTTNQAEVRGYVQQGQQEIVSWYQDKDDRHIASAKSNFRKALKLQPKDNVDSLHGLAVVADLEKNYAVAEQHYQLALAQAPGNSNILGNLGYSYLLQDRLEESERYLSRATQLDPGNIDAVKHLGDVYARTGQPGKAQAVLAQVMSPEEARKIVEEQTQLRTQGQGESLMGKFFPKQNTEISERLPVEQQQLTQANQRSHREMMKFHNAAAGYQYPGGARNQIEQAEFEYESRLKAELTSIDQERSQNLTGGPVMIHSESGQFENHPAQFHHEPQMRANTPGQIPQQDYANHNSHFAGNPGPTPQQYRSGQPNEYSEMSPYQQQQFARTQQLKQANSQLQRPAEIGTVSRHNQPTAYSQPQQQMAQIDPLRKPWGSLADDKATQVSYEQQESMIPYPGPQSEVHDSSHHDPRSGYQGRMINTYAGGQQFTAQQNQIPQPLHQEHQPNSHESASMQAAKLGMGVGPGNMFPTVNETSPRQQPGMHSNWNGGSYQQPPRHLPTDLPPMDLTQAYAGQPMVNSLGQQIPGSNVTNQYGQFGTASRYNSSIQQLNSSAGSSQEAQARLYRQQQEMEQQLRDQRIPSQEQFNQQSQDVWNQRPLAPHVPASGGPRMLSPAEYGGMVPVNPQPETGRVPTYPYAEQLRTQGEYNTELQRNQPAQPNQQRINTPTRYYDANSNQNIIEPPPYQSTFNNQGPMNSNGAQNQFLDSGVQRTNYSTPVNSTNRYSQEVGNGSRSQANMPMIIPGGP